MSSGTTDHICNAKKYLVIGDESEWGTLPGSPTYYHLPVFSYDVRFRPENRQAQPYIGLFSQVHNENIRGYPAGQLVAALYGWKPSGLNKSLAEYLLSWAIAGAETCETPSKFTEWAEGPNVANKRHLGLRVNTAILSGSEGEPLMLQLGLVGKSEAGQNVVTSAQELPSGRNGLVEMQFSRLTCEFDDEELSVRAIAMRVNNGLSVKFNNSTNPSLLLKTTRSVELVIVPQKGDDTFDALRRSLGSNDFTGALTMRGLHNGTGTGGTSWTVVRLDFPRLGFVDADEDAENRNDIAYQAVQLRALHPDGSDESGFGESDVNLTVTEE